MNQAPVLLSTRASICARSSRGYTAIAARRCLLVDHDVDLISATCAATLVLDFGSPIAYGPTPDVLADPKVRAAYLGVVEETT